MATQLILGWLDEETAFEEFDVDCDAGSSSVTTGSVPTTSPSSTTETRPVLSAAELLWIMMARPSRPRARPASGASIAPCCRRICSLLGIVGPGSGPPLGRPSPWTSPGPARRPALAAELTAAADAAWAADTLAGLADSCTTLADGTELLVGRIAFAAEGPAFALPPDAGPSLGPASRDCQCGAASGTCLRAI